MYKQRHSFFRMYLAIGASTFALAQTAAPLAGPASSGTASTVSVPDFSGIWTRPYLGGDLPRSAPGPLGRLRGVPCCRLVGDYTNPILKPKAVEAVKRQGETELNGAVAPNTHSRCWPPGVPLVLFGTNASLQVIQQPNQITFLYEEDYVVRRVRLNERHPLRLTPSWYGDSVGHYEGDTLVIETVGVKVGPFSTVDRFGTPYTEALHVVERYRLVDYQVAKGTQERTLQLAVVGVSDPIGMPIDPNPKGKGLQLHFTVEDEGVFTMPYSATLTYRRALGEWPEVICAENTREYHVGKDTAVPRADMPDF
jgi:hypothetical protein